MPGTSHKAEMGSPPKLPALVPLCQVASLASPVTDRTIGGQARQQGRRAEGDKGGEDSSILTVEATGGP